MRSITVDTRDYNALHNRLHNVRYDRQANAYVITINGVDVSWTRSILGPYWLTLGAAAAVEVSSFKALVEAVAKACPYPSEKADTLLVMRSTNTPTDRPFMTAQDAIDKVSAILKERGALHGNGTSENSFVTIGAEWGHKRRRCRVAYVADEVRAYQIQARPWAPATP